MDLDQKYYFSITECEDILLEAGEWKIVYRGGKKKKKLICPPGMKAVGKVCKRMGAQERKKRRQGLKVTRKKAKGKAARIKKKRLKALKKRSKLGL